MDFQTLSNTKEFQNLHPLKQQIIKEIANNSTKTSPELMLTKMMSINQELKKRNLSFSKAESKLLIQIMKSDMSADDQKKIDLLMGLLNK